MASQPFDQDQEQYLRMEPIQCDSIITFQNASVEKAHSGRWEHRMQLQLCIKHTETLQKYGVWKAARCLQEATSNSNKTVIHCFTISAARSQRSVFGTSIYIPYCTTYKAVNAPSWVTGQLTTPPDDLGGSETRPNINTEQSSREMMTLKSLHGSLEWVYFSFLTILAQYCETTTLTNLCVTSTIRDTSSIVQEMQETMG